MAEVTFEATDFPSYEIEVVNENSSDKFTLEVGERISYVLIQNQSGLNFVQEVAATVWTLDHNFGFHPAVEVWNELGEECEGAVTNPSLSQTVITFSEALAGTARLT